MAKYVSFCADVDKFYPEMEKPRTLKTWGDFLISNDKTFEQMFADIVLVNSPRYLKTFDFY